ncbi:hypothetical protein EGW08_021919, partial [Elysia chlorotica]
MASSTEVDYTIQKVLSDIHVHAERQNCTEPANAINSRHDGEKTLSRFYFKMPHEVESAPAELTSTKSLRDVPFCERRSQKSASDPSEHLEGNPCIQNEEICEIDISPTDIEQTVDNDGDLIICRRKPKDVCYQRLIEDQSCSLIPCYGLSEESNPSSWVIT